MFGNKGNIDMIKMRPKIFRIFVGERNESRASFPRKFYPLGTLLLCPTDWCHPNLI